MHVTHININIGINEHTCGYQNCNTSEILIFLWVCQNERIFIYLSYYVVQ